MKLIVLGLLSILAGIGYMAICFYFPQPGAWWYLEFSQARYVLFALLIAGWLLVRTGLRRKPRRS